MVTEQISSEIMLLILANLIQGAIMYVQGTLVYIIKWRVNESCRICLSVSTNTSLTMIKICSNYFFPVIYQSAEIKMFAEITPV